MTDEYSIISAKMMDTITGQIKEACHAGLREVKDDLDRMFTDVMSDEAVWGVIDAVIREQLEKASCNIVFDDDGASCLVTVGEGDLSCELDIIMDEIDDYASIQEEEGREDVTSRITGIDQFIARLAAAKRHYESLIADYEARK